MAPHPAKNRARGGRWPHRSRPPAAWSKSAPAHRPDSTTRRVVQIDGKQSRSQTSLSDHVSAVWLTPQMDRLFPDGASGRRRFLDRLVFGFDAAHAGRVSAYEHMLRERARLLRDGGDAVWLDALESDMAEHGVAIAAARRELTARLARLTEAPAGPFPGAEVDRHRQGRGLARRRPGACRGRAPARGAARQPGGRMPRPAGPLSGRIGAIWRCAIWRMECRPRCARPASRRRC